MASINKTDDGYVVRWHWYENGKRRGNHKTFEKLRDAKTYAAEIEIKISAGALSKSSSLTVSQYLNEWLVTFNENTRDNTYADYRTSIQKHIEPRVGNVLLRKLTTTECTGKLKLDTGGVKTGHGLV